MNVKIDTKEKFTVITPVEGHISANMTGDLLEMLTSCLEKPVPHVILNLANVHELDITAAEKIAAIQQQFYEKNCSFVVCALQEKVELLLDEAALLETMNVTPTESEAWDIVQMEEVERELLGDFDESEP